MIKGYASLNETREYFNKIGISEEYVKNNGDFYTIGIGIGTHLGNFSDEHSNLYKDAIEYGLKNGINFIDTSVTYREMKSEKDIGHVLDDLINKKQILKREEVIVATKGGQIYGDCDINVRPIDYLEEILIPEGILNIEDVNVVHGHRHTLVPYFYETTIELSKNNLGIETIDIHYIHNPEISKYVLGEDEFYQQLKILIEFYEEQVEKENIRFYGISSWEAFTCNLDSNWHISMEKIINIAKEVKGEHHHLKFIQLPYNIYNQNGSKLKNQIIDGEYYNAIDAANKLGLNVTVSAPLNQFKDGDNDISLTEKLNFIKNAKGIYSAIIGSKRKEHIKENLNFINSCTANC